MKEKKGGSFFRLDKHKGENPSQLQPEMREELLWLGNSSALRLLVLPLKAPGGCSNHK